MARDRVLRSDRIRLEDVTTLTFYADRKTTHHRKPAVNQLTCQGKGCKRYQPDVVQCANVGGSPPDWACHAELPDDMRMGRVEVSCEGWTDDPNDPYVLKGSCGLDYRLVELTSSSRGYSDSSESWSPIPILAILLALFLLYRWYNAAIAPPGANDGPRGPGGGGPPWNPFNRPGDDPDDPPPPYKSSSTATRGGAHQQQGQNGPGFWTGLAGGALGGVAAQQLFRGRQQQQQQPRRRVQPDPLLYGRRDQDWDRGEGPSGFGGMGGGSSMRTSTGYGGTRNR